MQDPKAKHLTCGEGIYPRSAAQQSQNHPARFNRNIVQSGLGPLRSPSGINPLATSNSFTADSWLNSLRHKKGQSRQGLPFLFAAINHIGVRGKHLTCGEGIYPRSAAQQSQTIQLGSTGTLCRQDLGPLRSPAGINPLATGISVLIGFSIRHKKGQSRQGLPFFYLPLRITYRLYRNAVLHAAVDTRSAQRYAPPGH